MPCLVILIALVAPRLAIFLLVVFSDYIGEAFDGGLLLPLIGFFCLPATTLAYAFAVHNGGVQGLFVILLILAVLFDVGVIGGARRRARREKRREKKGHK